MTREPIRNSTLFLSSRIFETAAVYESIQSDFDNLASGGAKIFEMGELSQPATESAINPMKLNDADEVVIEKDVEMPDASESDEDDPEPIAKRVRFQQDQRETTQLKRASPEEIAAKVASYGTLEHPTDGTTAAVVEAVQRKRKGADELDWWLKLKWSDGFEKYYKEVTLRKQLGLDDKAQ